MLQRFWSYLFFLRRSFPAEIMRSLDDCRMPVEWAPRVLQVLTTFVVLNEDPPNNNGHKKKRGKRATLKVNTEPFAKLGVDVPSTTEAAQQLATIILQDQKRILKVTSCINPYSTYFITHFEYSITSRFFAAQISRIFSRTSISHKMLGSILPLLSPYKKLPIPKS
jgi:hypothetical protein